MSVQSLQNSLNGASLQTTNTIQVISLVTLAQENQSILWSTLGLTFDVAPLHVVAVNNDVNWALIGVGISFDETSLSIKQLPPDGETYEVFNLQLIIYAP